MPYPPQYKIPGMFLVVDCSKHVSENLTYLSHLVPYNVACIMGKYKLKRGTPQCGNGMTFASFLFLSKFQTTANKQNMK